MKMDQLLLFTVFVMGKKVGEHMMNHISSTIDLVCFVRYILILSVHLCVIFPAWPAKKITCKWCCSGNTYSRKRGYYLEAYRRCEEETEQRAEPVLLVLSGVMVGENRNHAQVTERWERETGECRRRREVTDAAEMSVEESMDEKNTREGSNLRRF